MAKKVFKGSKEKLSKKIEKVKNEDPGLTNKQAVGKAAGILAWHEKQMRKKKK